MNTLQWLIVNNNYMSDFSNVAGFTGVWDNAGDKWYPYGDTWYVFNPQIKVITEINEENFPDENLRNYLLEQNGGNPNVHIENVVWITPKEEIPENTEPIYPPNVVEDCTYTAANIVSAKIIDYAIDPDYVPDNNQNNGTQGPHTYAYAVWEIVKETGGNQETITHKVYYCLDDKNPASTVNMTYLAYLSVVCSNPFYESESPLKAATQQDEITVHTFTALATLEGGITGISQPKTNNITIFPNPAQNFVLIQANSPIEKIEIYNQSGVRILINENVSGKVDISSLPDGFYLARIYLDGIPVNKKFIVKK